MPDQPALIDVADGAEVHLDLGASAHVALRAPGATGHRWRLVGEPAHVDVAAQARLVRTEQEGLPRPGQSARTVFDVTGSKAGSDTLTFALQRDWEDHPVQTVHVRVVVG